MTLTPSPQVLRITSGRVTYSAVGQGSHSRVPFTSSHATWTWPKAVLPGWEGPSPSACAHLTCFPGRASVTSAQTCPCMAAGLPMALFSLFKDSPSESSGGVVRLLGTTFYQVAHYKVRDLQVLSMPGKGEGPLEPQCLSQP